MQKQKSFKAKRTLRPGEYLSRTQMPIGSVHDEALKIRVQGISQVRKALEKMQEMYKENDVDSLLYAGARLSSRQLIASLNYTVAEATKELKKRGVK